MFFTLDSLARHFICVKLREIWLCPFSSLFWPLQLHFLSFTDISIRRTILKTFVKSTTKVSHHASYLRQIHFHEIFHLFCSSSDLFVAPSREYATWTNCSTISFWNRWKKYVFQSIRFFLASFWVLYDLFCQILQLIYGTI